MINYPALEMFTVLSSFRVEQLPALSSSSSLKMLLLAMGKHSQEVISAHKYL